MVQFKQGREIKEFRAYVCEVEKLPFEMNSNDIDNWSNYEEHHQKLTQDAERFVSYCEEQGTVYTLHSLQNSLNYEELNSNNVFIYITNNY